MSRIRIVGGKPIRGDIKISGSKNAVLPIIAASILSKEPCIIYNVPHLEDVTNMLQLLLDIGVKVQGIYNITNQNTIKLDPSSIKHTNTSADIAQKLRASFLLLGSLLTRFHETRIPMPGGCNIGERGINIHLDALRNMGAVITIEDNTIIAKGKLTGAELYLPIASVGATENILMAATLAKGKTIINNASMEPEVTDLAHYLLNMGAKIDGIGTGRLIIDGVSELHSSQHEVIPDRIEAFTYATAAIMTDGEVVLEGVNMDHMKNLFEILSAIGGNVEILSETSCSISKPHEYIKPYHVITGPHPRIPTDIQPILTTLLTIADGNSIIEERVFEKRFNHIPELRKMEAKITTQGNRAEIAGISKLKSHQNVIATDLRAGAALVIAALSATGETVIHNADHLDRGYETLERKLSQCGAEITRLT